MVSKSRDLRVERDEWISWKGWLAKWRGVDDQVERDGWLSLEVWMTKLGGMVG
jgi:hypothetical protein